MVTLLHDAEVGQPDGTTVTAGNSGGGSNTAFTTVTVATSHTFQYTTASADHGSFGMAVQGNGVGATFGEDASRNDATLAFRAYIKFPNTMPSTTPQFWQFRTASANVVRIAMNSSNQFLIQVGSAGTNAFTASALTLTTGTWYRVEMEIFSVSATVGSLAFRAYVGDSTTASVNSGTLTSLNLGGSNVAVIRRGLLSSAYADVFYLDDDRVDEGVTTPIGPVSVTGTVAASVPTVTASIAGTATNAGTLTASIPTVTGSITGASVNAGTLSATVPTVTFSETGTSANAGALTAQVPTLTFSESGQSVNPASVAAQVPLLTFSDSGTSTNAGTLATKVPLLTWSQTDTGINPGTMNATLPTLTFSELGQATNPGTLTSSVPLLKYAQTNTSNVLRDITVTAVALAPRFTTSPLTARFTTNSITARFATAALQDRFSTLPVAPRFTTTPEDT